MPSEDFRTFAESNFDILARFAAVITRDPDLAHDVLVDTLIKVEARWSRIRTLQDPLPYVRAMLVSQSCDSYRTGKRRRRLLDDVSQLRESTGPDAFAAVSDRELLKHALDQLPERQRCAVVGRYYLGWSDQELADLLSCSQSTVRTHLSRALSSLRANADLSPEGI